MIENDCEKKLMLIQQVILLDNQFSELISRFFSVKSKQELLNKTIIQELRINKKREIIKSILGQYPEDINDVEKWNKCALNCIQIRNAVVHNVPDEDYYNLNIDGKNGRYKANALLNVFKKSWNVVNPPILSILNKLKEDNIMEDIVLVRISLRNYKGWYVDIYNVQIENSGGEEKELHDYPDKQYNVNEYEEEVKQEIKNWLIGRGVNITDVEFEVYLDWIETEDDN